MVRITKSRMNRFDYEEWVAYFKNNNEKRLEVDFSRETGLSDEERDLIFPSIRAFRKGEGSDGGHLMETVEAWVAKSGQTAYREAMQWFVREENWHSAYLKKYMDFYRVEDMGNSFLDNVFRRLRKLGGLRCEVTVLVTAEMIALTYYDALSECTASPALKSICRQMLHDELPHIMFQSYTLRQLKKRPADRLARVLLMELTMLFVWGAFHKVYRAGGYGFIRFCRENLGYLRQSADLANGKGVWL